MATAQLSGALRHIRQLAGGGALKRCDRQLLDDFAGRRDEAAFAALVARHGGMVLRVCRRVLGHEQDAEDAFQATFLVLARDARSIRKHESLASWLHGVAHRIALNVLRTASRRRAREGQPRPVVPTSSPGLLWEEVRTVLDEELGRLAEPFRSAFVLCALEGKTGPEAAALLGCKEATVYTRMNRARRLLQKVLAARGIELAALLGALAVAGGAARAAPAVLVRSAVRFGLLVAAGEPAAEIPSHVAALAAGVTRAMFLTKAKILAVALLAAGLLAAGAGALTCQALAAKAEQTPPAAKSEPRADAKMPEAARKQEPAADQQKAADDKDGIAYGGRVLGPDGRPVAGAELFLTLPSAYLKRPAPSPLYATSGADGRFQFKAPKAVFANYQAASLVATARGLGTAWRDVDLRDEKGDLTLRLVEDVPITGRVVDLQGRPVEGATVRVLHVKAADGDDLGPWLRAAGDKQSRDLQLEQKYIPRQLMSPEVPGLPRQVVTDADGRFRLAGFGRDRLVSVRVSAPAIATQDLHILTRAGRPVEVAETLNQDGTPASVRTYHPANFRHVAGLSRPIVGVVRDRDTRKPLAGVTVQSFKLANNPIHGLDIIETTTDAQGRYRLTGMPKGRGNKVMTIPADDQPYLRSAWDVPDDDGLDAVTLDIALKRGVWVEGRITDKATGKPVAAPVQYFALHSNPHLGDYAGFDGAFSGQPTWNVKEDGSYRVVGMPGPGLIATWRSDHYLLASERDDADGAKTSLVSTAPNLISSISYNALAPVDPAPGAESVKRDVALDPGLTFTGTVVGPDDKPLSGALAFGLTGWAGWEGAPLKTASFTVRAFNPRRPRAILFRHPEKGLAGVLEPPKDASRPVTVRLRPAASAAGRLVDEDGRPRANVEMDLAIRVRGGSWDAYSLPQKIKTDKDGRFRADTLLPGYQFRLSAPQGDFDFGDGLRPGETKDLGDVRMRRAEE